MEHQAGLAPIKVCILSPEAELRESLALDTAAAGYRVEQKFSEDQQLVEFISASSVDHIVLIDVQHQREERFTLMKQLCAKRPHAIVALASEADPALGARAVQAGAQALLISPVRSKDISAAFSIAVHQQRKQACRKEVNREGQGDPDGISQGERSRSLPAHSKTKSGQTSADGRHSQAHNISQ